MLTKRLAMLFAAAVVLFLTVACMLFYPSRGPLKFEPAELPAAQVGVPYDATITLIGNETPAIDFSLDAGALPRGLALEKIKDSQNAAHVFGVPEQAGTFNFRIFVWCYGTNISGQTGVKDYSLVVK